MFERIRAIIKQNIIIIIHEFNYYRLEPTSSKMCKYNASPCTLYLRTVLACNQHLVRLDKWGVGAYIVAMGELEGKCIGMCLVGEYMF